MATFQLNLWNMELSLWNREEQVEYSQTISVPPNVLKIKMHAIIVYFCRRLLFLMFKNAVLNVSQHLKCFRWNRYFQECLGFSFVCSDLNLFYVFV